MNVLLPSKDPLGQAVLDYLDTRSSKDIIVESDLAEDDVIPSAWLFRDFHDMPSVECKALELCRGRILDVGAGAGSHSLWLQSRGLEVLALDLSPLCCKAMELRGVRQVVNKDIMGVSGSFDTLLFLMNGLGIGGHHGGIRGLLAHCASLLAPGGQILFDSTDITDLYEGELPGDSVAPGELTYTMSYGECRGEPFPWSFLDPGSFEALARSAGFKLECLTVEKETGAWLGRLCPSGT